MATLNISSNISSRRGSIPGMKPQASGLLTEVGSIMMILNRDTYHDDVWHSVTSMICLENCVFRGARHTCLRRYQPAQQGVGSQRLQNGIQLKSRERLCSTSNSCLRKPTFNREQKERDFKAVQKKVYEISGMKE